MKKHINPLGIFLAVLALVILGGIIFAGAAHHFFTFLTTGGLAYALITESLIEAKREGGK